MAEQKPAGLTAAGKLVVLLVIAGLAFLGYKMLAPKGGPTAQVGGPVAGVSGEPASPGADGVGAGPETTSGPSGPPRPATGPEVAPRA